MTKQPNPDLQKEIERLASRVAELEKKERLLEEALRREKDSNVVKSRFIATAAHEFRTPLTAILNSAELLGMIGRTYDEEKYFEHIRKIQHATVYMTSLSNDVLTIMHIEVGNTKIKPAWFDFQNFCQQLIDELLLNGVTKHTITFSYHHAGKELYSDKY
ncbi:MAG: HAMP domain-containing sensor histidine kinase, partial [Bacteroidota bacterium]|nr:HAMP domain-containing sensor histidine kinase [Bacteroidota bacterium]